MDQLIEDHKLITCIIEVFRKRCAKDESYLMIVQVVAKLMLKTSKY